MGLFKKKRQEEPIPQSLQLLPPQKPFDENDFDDDLKDEEEEEPIEEVEEEPIKSKEEKKSIPIPKPIEEEDDIEVERQKIQKKIEELDKKIALKKETEEKKKKEQEQPINNLQERIILTLQNHEERMRNLEAALFRVRSSI